MPAPWSNVPPASLRPQDLVDDTTVPLDQSTLLPNTENTISPNHSRTDAVTVGFNEWDDIEM